MGTGDTETKWCNSCGKKYEMYSMDIIIKLESVFEIVIWMNSIQFSYQADKKQFRLLNRNGTKERRKKTFVSIFFWFVRMCSFVKQVHSTGLPSNHHCCIGIVGEQKLWNSCTWKRSLPAKGWSARRSMLKCLNINDSFKCLKSVREREEKAKSVT